MENNGTYRFGSNQGKLPDFKKLGKIVLIVAVVLFVLVLALTCVYTVDDKQQAVVTTFGKVTDITNAGLHFKLPFGIQKVQKVDVNVYQKIELGYVTQGEGQYAVKTNESTMITGDYNIVNVDFFVEYKISNPERYLYSSNNPELILRNLIQSQMRNVVGSASVDSVLTDGKEKIQMQVKELVAEILEEYDIGLTLVEVRIQDAEPPTKAVIEAFKAVETAKQHQRPWSMMPRPIRTPSCRMPRPRPTSCCRMPNICGKSVLTRPPSRWQCSRLCIPSMPKIRTLPAAGCTTRQFPKFCPG